MRWMGSWNWLGNEKVFESPLAVLLICICSAKKTKGELTVTVNIERFHDEGFTDQWRTDGGC